MTHWSFSLKLIKTICLINYMNSKLVFILAPNAQDQDHCWLGTHRVVYRPDVHKLTVRLRM